MNGQRLPSKPYQYWGVEIFEPFKTLSILGNRLPRVPSKPYQYWGVLPFGTFKTLSILGLLLYPNLQNPINTGCFQVSFPSKPYQYWDRKLKHFLQNPINTGFRAKTLAFKTLSILGYRHQADPSKPYQYWEFII